MPRKANVRRRQTSRSLATVVLVVMGALSPLVPSGHALGQPGPAGRALAAVPRPAATAASGTVWLCRPGMPADPCTSSLTTSVVSETGATSVVSARASTGSKFDCFYVYPTVSTEAAVNADLRAQPAEKATAMAQAAWFSTACRVWAPMYRQVTLAVVEKWAKAPGHEAAGALAAVTTAYQSLRAGFEDYLQHYNQGRPIIFIGHSQGATMVIRLLQQFMDRDPTLRRQLVLAIIAGGNVVVPVGSDEGGSFAHIPLCRAKGQTGCVIAYSSFPHEPPAASLFGRPGQGVSLMAGQTGTHGLGVACVNPAAPGGGSAALDPLFPTDGLIATPWARFPGLYVARCESAGGATWLQVTKATGAQDLRPVVKQTEGPEWGYHVYDINLALGNLLADVAAAESGWQKTAVKRAG